MSLGLILRPTAIAGKPHLQWALQLRYNGPVETDYYTLARVSDEIAYEIMDAGEPYWLFGDPREKSKIFDYKEALAQLAPEDLTKEQLFLEVVRLREKLLKLPKEEPKLEVIPGIGTPPKVALAQVMEQIKDTDTVFICVVEENGDAWVKSSHFQSHKIHIAVGHLTAYGVEQSFNSRNNQIKEV